MTLEDYPLRSLAAIDTAKQTRSKFKIALEEVYLHSSELF